ncbi:MAG TPA: hypothetical protein VJQ83_07745 [Tepidiformaceae bacterium]|nr:hypothetical protein [Tepidiformaceae bacterium]
MPTHDDDIHPVGADKAWSESYYFNFYDPDREVGMFTRMGLRPNEGWCDALHVLYLGGERVAFTYGREALPEMTDRLQVGGLQLTRGESFKRWTVAYDGPAQDIADPSILITRRRERPEGWFKPANLDMSVEFEALAEPHYSGEGQRGHFEQPGAVRGTVTLGDETWDVSSYGVRDKSWGPRNWSGGSSESPAKTEQPGDEPRPFITWFSMNFGADIALGGTCGRGPDGQLNGSGWIHANGKTQSLTQLRVEDSSYKPRSILHTGMHLTATAGDGTEYDITGEVITVCPTKIPMPQGATFVNEGLARFTMGGATGYGIAEYWHNVAQAGD